MSQRCLVFLACLTSFACLATAKICYKSCSGSQLGAITKLDFDGCRRRSSYMNQGPRRMDFRCDGANPPPCTVLSGDETDFITDFYAAFPIRNLKMAVHWVPSFGFPIAWPGLDQNGCNGLQGNCTAEGGTKLQFRRKIKILSAYPPGIYNLKVEYHADNPNGGDQLSIGCGIFKLRIL